MCKYSLVWFFHFALLQIGVSSKIWNLFVVSCAHLTESLVCPLSFYYVKNQSRYLLLCSLMLCTFYMQWRTSSLEYGWVCLYWWRSLRMYINLLVLNWVCTSIHSFYKTGTRAICSEPWARVCLILSWSEDKDDNLSVILNDLFLLTLIHS